MKKSLIKRVSRIISGGFNAMMDAIENAAPETVMEEAIGEVEAAIEEVRAELGRSVANKHLADSRLMEEKRKHARLSEQIKVAVQEGRDDLAEAAIATQLDIEAQISLLESTIANCGDQEKELEGYIRALLAKKREMQAELGQFRDSQARPPAMSTSAAAANSTVGENVARAASVFDRVAENTSGVAAGEGSAFERQHAARLAELEDLARKNRIQERLVAIKGEMNKK